MEPRTLQYVADACHGHLVRGQAALVVNRVSTDSRKMKAGGLFVALRGDRFDGHKFIAEAAQAGAVAVLIEPDGIDQAPESCAVIVVDNTRAALGRLAARYRKDFELPIVAVGGSNGKTSTKELLAAVLRKRFNTLWSEASFNNDIGVPLTLLNLTRTHTAAVLEVGTNHPGELQPLLAMIQPRFGVVTSLGREHLEFFGNLDGVLNEEGSLADALPADGTLFVNGDCLGMDNLAKRTRAKVIRCGIGVANDWRGRLVVLDDTGTTFGVRAPEASWCGAYHINLLGRHQVVNALIALAVGAELGVARAQLLCGLAQCQPARMRMQLWRSGGLRVLDDAYNANVDSMLAALQTLRDLPCRGRRVAVLGDMSELGEHTEAGHIEIGRRAAELGINHLFTVGRMASVTGQAARSAGLESVEVLSDVESAGPIIRAFVAEGDTVLLKASRSVRLERIREWLLPDRSSGEEQTCFTI
jgi:UDP-N-acetylmuramoyl-tripeptide--D-alanyl-D-alanine ligase